ncbi:MAG: beta-aspartyl-peptidase, partial [Clostridia bacterium]|nr:beta-aspartyl-peptidase [Clostridia bacterium]
MKLELGKIKVNNVEFADKTFIEKGTLYINKEELIEYLKEDSNIQEVDIDLARPGESVRIVPIKDIVQPRYK